MKPFIARLIPGRRRGEGVFGVTACLVAAVQLGGCGPGDAPPPPPPVAGETEAEPKTTIVWFEEYEPGVVPYHTRMIVNRDFLRMDDGQDGDDFVLFDRREGSIRSVSHDSRSVFSIPHRKSRLPEPSDLVTGAREETQENAPAIGGAVPVHVELTVNGRVCTNVVAAPGLMPEANRALREFHQALAAEHASNLEKTPPEMRSDCMLANMIYYPVRHLEYGFPVREWDYRGYARSLKDFDPDAEVDPALFEVPEGYGAYSTGTE